MNTINTSMGRYSLKAKDHGNHILGSIAINDEGGTQLTLQEFEEHYLDDVVNNVIYPITGGNRDEITRTLGEQMVKAGFEQPHLVCWATCCGPLSALTCGYYAFQRRMPPP